MFKFSGKKLPPARNRPLLGLGLCKAILLLVMALVPAQGALSNLNNLLSGISPVASGPSTISRPDECSDGNAASTCSWISLDLCIDTTCTLTYSLPAANLGSIVFYFDDNIYSSRGKITIAVAVGSVWQDCYGGAPVYIEGVVNCIVQGVTQIRFTYVVSAFIQLKFTEILALEQPDYSQLYFSNVSF